MQKPVILMINFIFPTIKNSHQFTNFLYLLLLSYAEKKNNIKKKTRVRIWLYEDVRMHIEGQIIGFDEYMNMVLDDAVEIDSKKNSRQEVGRILLKGDSITLLQ